MKKNFGGSLPSLPRSHNAVHTMCISAVRTRGNEGRSPEIVWGPVPGPWKRERGGYDREDSTRRWPACRPRHRSRHRPPRCPRPHRAAMPYRKAPGPTSPPGIPPPCHTRAGRATTREDAPSATGRCPPRKATARQSPRQHRISCQASSRETRGPAGIRGSAPRPRPAAAAPPKRRCAGATGRKRHNSGRQEMGLSYLTETNQ